MQHWAGAFTLVGGNTTTASVTPGTCSPTSVFDAPNSVIAAVYPITTTSLTPAVAGTNVATIRATDTASNTGTFTITGGQQFVGKQSFVASEVKLVGDLTGGGFNAGGTDAGGSFAVTQEGYIGVGTTYGGNVNLINGSTGALVTPAFGEGGPTGLAVDSYNNLYSTTLWDSKIYKYPYLGGGTWATAGGAWPACTGPTTDTARCVMPSLSKALKALAFDAAGNLFAVTAGDNKNAIYEVAAANLYTAGTETLVYQADATHHIGSIALDPWGNLFFTEAVYSDVGNGVATNSRLSVLPYTSGFATTPTVLVTYTNTDSNHYNNVLGGVNVDWNGTVYYTATNSGIFAFPNNPTDFADAAHAYMVSAKGAYQIQPDGKGNLWAVGYDNTGGKPAVFKISLNNVVVPDSMVGAASSVNDVLLAASTVDCSGALTFQMTGGNALAATVTLGSTCSMASFGDAPHTVNAATYAATKLEMMPGVIGVNTTIVTASDGTNTGTITITMNSAQAAGNTPQTINFADIADQTMTSNLTLSATATSGLPVSFMSTTPSVCTVDSTTKKVTFLGVGTCTIMATQSGDNTYKGADPVTKTFHVALASQTITFQVVPDQTVGSTFSLTGQYAVTASSGLPVTLTATTGTCVVKDDGVTVMLAATGTCTIQATQGGDTTYAPASPVSRSFVITAAGTQTITFLNPGPQGVGFPLALTATTDAPGLKISYTASPAAVCKVSGSAVTLLAPGNCTIVASQGGNNQYQAAADVSQTFAVLAWGTQTITFNNPGAQKVGVSIVLSASTTATLPTALKVVLASTTTDICTLSATDNRTVNFLKAGTCTIVASQPGDLVNWGPAAPVTQSFNVNATSWVQFTLKPSVTSLDVKVGQPSSAVTIQVETATGFTSDVSFSCSGLPAGAVCRFYPATISLPGSTWTSLTVDMSSASAAVHPNSRPLSPLFPATTSLALMGCCFLGSKKRRVRIFALLAMTLVGLVLLNGCGGSSSKSTQSAQLTVTVTATAGVVQQTTQITLNTSK